MSDEEHGFGGIQSPPDERDLVADTDLMVRLAGATSVPGSFLLGKRPPVSDQGMTPQCVAYSSAYEQQRNDRDEFGKWVAFNRGQFFTRIGGGPGGAVLRYALDEMLDTGYPEAQDPQQPGRHQIAAYFRIEQTKTAIMHALATNQGVLTVGPWYDSWMFPYNDPKGTLPPASGGANGHAWWVVGYDDYGVIGQNSWGTAWAANGTFRLSWYQFLNYMWEVWRTADEQTASAIVKAKINAIDVTIRTTDVLGERGTMEGSRWGETRSAGIYSWSAKKIVATPWNRGFRFVRMAAGARHGMQPYPSAWAVIVINGQRRCVARPLVTRYLG